MSNKKKYKSKGERPTGQTVAMRKRAMLAAQRATILAVAGFPSFDQLQARTAKFFARVEKKLDAVPPERRQAPPATIAAQAAFQYALLGEGPEAAELRQMFENLVARSMDKSTANRTHPAFVQMIGQMSSDEARMLSSLAIPLRMPIIEVRYVQIGMPRYFSAGFVCDFGRGIEANKSAQSTSLSNLERLGIIDITFETAIHDDSGRVYEPLVERMRLEFKDTLEFEDGSPLGPPVDRRGIIQFSAIGQDLWETCVRSQP